MAAISAVTLAPGSSPPRLGLAPWLSLTSIARTGAPATTSLSRSRLNRPSASRQPKYAVPIWKISSPPMRWYGDSPPSPVLCRQPARAAPRLSASIALPDSAPKLIADTLTTDAGRNALAGGRHRAPSREGSHTSCPAVGADGGTARPNVRCLMTG